jgi:ketosteroid isomerase-like protein
MKSTGLSSDDRAALSHIAETDAAIVLARDWGALTARFAEDAARMPPNAPEIRGLPAIRESVELMPPIVAFTFRMASLEGTETLAYMRADWAYTLAPPNAEPIVDSGKILIVFAKQEDGAWRTVADAWNSNHPVRG